MQKAPSFFLTAIGASRIVGGPPGPDSPLLLIFHGNAGAETAFHINADLRAIYPSIDQLQIASIIDLRNIPRFMRSAVQQTIMAAFQTIARQIPRDVDPREYVVLAPDWEGKVTHAFAMDGNTQDVGIAIITAPWIVRATYQGKDVRSKAIALVKETMQNPRTAIDEIAANS
jgi:hypothetical protein